jgi:hypothetical protein
MFSPTERTWKKTETVIVQRFVSVGCGCHLTNGSCSSTFTAEAIESYRSQCSELSRAELDGQLAASTTTSTLHSSKHRHPAATRQRLSIPWMLSLFFCRVSQSSAASGRLLIPVADIFFVMPPKHGKEKKVTEKKMFAYWDGSRMRLWAYSLLQLWRLGKRFTHEFTENSRTSMGQKC